MSGNREGIVAFRDVVKEYRHGAVGLDGVNVVFPAGEIIGILGENGAGKTTLINLIMGSVFPTSGTVSVLSAPPGADKRIGYVPDGQDFHFEFSPYQLLGYYAQIRGMSGANSQAARDRVINELGLSDSRHQRLSDLPKGIVQRFSIAQSLLAEPKLLILDEPATHLDPIWQRRLTDILVEERNRKTTVIISSHLLAHLESVCDSILFLEKGRVKYFGKPKPVEPDSKPSPTLISLAEPLFGEHLDRLTRAGVKILSRQKLEVAGDKEQINLVLHYLIQNDFEIDYLNRDYHTLQRFFDKTEIYL